jgi:hypothetical protein
MTKKILTVFILGIITFTLGGCFQKKVDTTTTQTGIDTQETTSSMVDKVISTEVATEKPAEQATTYEYSNKEGWFTLQVPNQRTFQENVFNSLVMLYAPQPKGDTVKENLGIITEKVEGSVNLSGYYELTKGNLETIIPDFTLISKEDIKIDGINAIKIIYKGTQQEKKLQREQVIFLKNNTAYVCTYTATQDTFDSLVKDVEAIINSFKLN